MDVEVYNNKTIVANVTTKIIKKLIKHKAMRTKYVFIVLIEWKCCGMAI